MINFLHQMSTALPWILLILTFAFFGIVYLKLQQKTKQLLEKDEQLKDLSGRVSKLAQDSSLISQNLKESDGQLKTANLQLKAVNVLKDDFVSIASHELRTPMTAIRSYAWMALYKSDLPLSDKLERYLIRILISTERLINLVNDLLNVSRIEASKIEVNPEPVDLISLARDVIDEIYYSKSTSKKIQFQLLESSIPKVFADPEKLREVMINLVGNSVKFTPPGGSVTIGFFTDGKTVETSIRDTGIGFPKEDLARLFQKFGKLDKSYVSISTSGGTGLGLYISRGLIELMYGKIWASSEGINKGSTFTFSLPVASKEVLERASEFTVKPKGEAKPLESVAI